MDILKPTRYLALALALAMASSGCHHPRDPYWREAHREWDDDTDDDHELEGVLVLFSVVLGIALVAAIVESLAHPDVRPAAAERQPLLETVRGQLMDHEGRPVAGARLEVRAARQYTAHPEKLPAITLESGPDGRFVLQMFRTNALCVDIVAEGKPPLRHWIVALDSEALKGLPSDQRDISFVSPHVREAELSRIVVSDH